MKKSTGQAFNHQHVHDHRNPQEGHHVANDGPEDAPAGQGHGHLGHLGAHEGHHVAGDGEANMFCRNLPPGQASFVRHHTQTLQCTMHISTMHCTLHLTMQCNTFWYRSVLGISALGLSTFDCNCKVSVSVSAFSQSSVLLKVGAHPNPPGALRCCTWAQCPTHVLPARSSLVQLLEFSLSSKCQMMS